MMKPSTMFKPLLTLLGAALITPPPTFAADCAAPVACDDSSPVIITMPCGECDDYEIDIPPVPSAPAPTPTWRITSTRIVPEADANNSVDEQTTSTNDESDELTTPAPTENLTSAPHQSDDRENATENESAPAPEIKTDETAPTVSENDQAESPADETAESATPAPTESLTLEITPAPKNETDETAPIESVNDQAESLADKTAESAPPAPIEPLVPEIAPALTASTERENEAENKAENKDKTATADDLNFDQLIKDFFSDENEAAPKNATAAPTENETSTGENQTTAAPAPKPEHENNRVDNNTEPATQPKGETQSVIEAIRRRGELRVGLLARDVPPLSFTRPPAANSAPQFFGGATENLDGLEYDLAQKIAQKLQVKLVLKRDYTDRAAIAESVRAADSEIDLGFVIEAKPLAGAEPKSSATYYEERLALFFNWTAAEKSAQAKIFAPADLNRPEITLAVSPDLAPQAEQLFPRATKKISAAPAQEVLDGAALAALDGAAAITFIRRSLPQSRDDLFYALLKNPALSYRVVMTAPAPELAKIVQEIIAADAFTPPSELSRRYEKK